MIGFDNYIPHKKKIIHPLKVGFGGNYFHLKESIFVEVGYLFVSGRRKRHVQRSVPRSVLFIETECKWMRTITNGDMQTLIKSNNCNKTGDLDIFQVLLSRRKPGFNSPWDYQINQLFTNSGILKTHGCASRCVFSPNLVLISRYC